MESTVPLLFVPIKTGMKQLNDPNECHNKYLYAFVLVDFIRTRLNSFILSTFDDFIFKFSFLKFNSADHVRHIPCCQHSTLDTCRWRNSDTFALNFVRIFPHILLVRMESGMNTFLLSIDEMVGIENWKRSQIQFTIRRSACGNRVLFLLWFSIHGLHTSRKCNRYTYYAPITHIRLLFRSAQTQLITSVQHVMRICAIFFIISRSAHSPRSRCIRASHRAHNSAIRSASNSNESNWMCFSCWKLIFIQLYIRAISLVFNRVCRLCGAFHFISHFHEAAYKFANSILSFVSVICRLNHSMPAYWKYIDSIIPFHDYHNAKCTRHSVVAREFPFALMCSQR